MLTSCAVCSNTIAVDYKTPGAVCKRCADRQREWTSEERRRFEANVKGANPDRQHPVDIEFDASVSRSVLPIFIFSLTFMGAVFGWLMHMVYRSFK